MTESENNIHAVRFKDVVKEDMAEIEVTEEEIAGRSNWRLKIRCGDP